MAADLTYNTKIQERNGGDLLVVASGGVLEVESGGTIQLDTGGILTGPGLVQSIRTRFTVAQVNAGATVLAAVAGFKYRLVSAILIAIGGAATSVTTVDILGTQTTGVKLFAGAQASLTQNTLVSTDDAGMAVLAAGASFVPNDVNTAITIGVTGSAITVATSIDVILTYCLEP